jgi:hypothetical protein
LKRSLSKTLKGKDRKRSWRRKAEHYKERKLQKEKIERRVKEGKDVSLFLNAGKRSINRTTADDDRIFVIAGNSLVSTLCFSSLSKSLWVASAYCDTIQLMLSDLQTPVKNIIS